MASHVGSTTPKTLNRRTVVGMMLGLGAAAVIGKPALATKTASGPAMFKTTAAVNLRSGPGTSHKAVLVMPVGTTVQASGKVASGFREVWYQNYIGWAHADFLVPVTGGGTDPRLIGLAVTTAAVNLRSGPSTRHQVLSVLAKGTLLERSDTVRDGFRYVVHQGVAGWIADAYLKPTTDGPGGQPVAVARTTAAVNFRARPSTSAPIIAVIPANTQVSLQPGSSNGFREVGYHGTYGWVYNAYLR